MTLRTIAGEMGISQGNLNYHFKKREDIIRELYFQLVARIDEKVDGKALEAPSLRALFDISVTIMDSFYKYRFFLLDFVQIIREDKKIRDHYLQLSRQREEQFEQLFSGLIKYGTLKKEEFVGQYANLYKRWNIMGDFWLSSALLTQGRNEKKQIQEYSRIIGESIIPYLTERGKREYFGL